MTVIPSLSDSSFPRRRRRRLKSLSFLPTLLTLGNLVCGFAAIHFSLRAMYSFSTDPSADQLKTLLHFERLLPSFLSVGAGLVILGMVFDCFDGLVARMTRSTTDFGGQLDSLADVVTCGVAPATLMVAFIMQNVPATSIVPSPLSEHALGRLAWVAAAVYVAFAAIRLARYNVEHAQTDFDHKKFRGLPSPGAAGLMASLIILQDRVSEAWRLATVYAMPVVALVAAFLMVSRVPYRRFYRTYLVGRQPFGHLMITVLVFIVFWLWSAPTLLVLMLWYALSGPVEWAFRRARGKKGGAVVGPVQFPAPDQKLA